MNKKTWMQWLVAAVMVVLAGALIASAEERMEIRVEKDGGDEVSVEVNGVTEVIHLEDLAEGETRTFDVGDHELVVKRVGDDLTIVSDGNTFGSFGDHKSITTNVWVTEDGENIEIDGDHVFAGAKTIVMNVDDCEDPDGEDCDGRSKTYTIRVDGDDVLMDGEQVIEIEEIISRHGGDGHDAIFISKDGNVHHPAMVGLHGLSGDLVKYRCEETGSTLLVKKDDALEDVYICPATGCVMTRVEEPDVKVIKVMKKVEVEDED